MEAGFHASQGVGNELAHALQLGIPSTRRSREGARDGQGAEASREDRGPRGDQRHGSKHAQEQKECLADPFDRCASA